MISTIYKSKCTAKNAAVVYLTIYQVFLFSFIQINFSRTIHDLYSKYSQTRLSLSIQDYWKPLDISKNDLQKESTGSSFIFEHSDNYLISKTEIKFVNIVYAILNNKLFDFKTFEKIKGNNFRSPPLSLS